MVLAKARVFRKTKDREGLCVSKVHGDAKDGCGTYCVLCTTSVGLIYSISLSRMVDTSKVKR